MRKFLMTALLGCLAVSGVITADDQNSNEPFETKGQVNRPAIHKELAEALNYQLRLELESAYLYLGISTYFAENNLDGFAKWFSIHSQEEMEHAMKVHQFLVDRGVSVEFPDLSAPKTSWDSPIEVFEEALAHEILVSQAISDEYSIAQHHKQYDVSEFLLWFLREQVEEENLFESVLNRLYMVEDADPTALLIIDIELGKRDAE